MFHVELRRNLEHACRFNMSEQALLASILIPWAGGRTIELGERTWRPDETTITVLEGPEIPIGGLTMSRGWPTAQREGRDVTKAVVASVRQSLAAKASAAATRAGDDRAGELDGVGSVGEGGSGGGVGSGGRADNLLADAFGLELLRTLGDGPLTLHAAWRLAGERHPGLQASGSLELAMNAVVSLLGASLVRVERVETGESLDLGVEQLERSVRAMDGWTSDDGPGALRIRRT